MKTKTRADLRIIGDNNAAGGKYNDVKIIGDSVVNGNLDCLNFKSVGDTKIEGSIKTHSTRVTGSLTVAGSLESDDIRIIGNVETDSDLKSKHLVSKGGVTVKGKVMADDIRLLGYSTIKKSCEAETFKSHGQLTIDGLLNAESVDIRIHGVSRILEIGGEEITIKRGHDLFEKFVKTLIPFSDFHKYKLIVSSIEGDEIRLESTKAKVVRGKDVIIGDGCEIELVEYEREYREVGKSVVKEKRNLNA